MAVMLQGGIARPRRQFLCAFCIIHFLLVVEEEGELGWTAQCPRRAAATAHPGESVLQRTRCIVLDPSGAVAARCSQSGVSPPSTGRRKTRS